MRPKILDGAACLWLAGGTGYLLLWLVTSRR